MLFVVDLSASGELRQRAPHQGRSGDRGLRRARARGRAEQRPGRRGVLHRPGRAVRRARQGAAPRAPGHQRPAELRARGPGTDLSAALAELEPMLRRRAVIFVLSDFLATGYESALGRLARRHDVVALQLIDPRERELPDAGLVTLWDPETGGWRRGRHGRPAGCGSGFAAGPPRSTRRWSGRCGSGRGSAAAGDRAAVRRAAADVLPAAGAACCGDDGRVVARRRDAVILSAAKEAVSSMASFAALRMALAAAGRALDLRAPLAHAQLDYGRSSASPPSRDRPWATR